jgi:hypothetical protein
VEALDPDLDLRDEIQRIALEFRKRHPEAVFTFSCPSALAGRLREQICLRISVRYVL